MPSAKLMCVVAVVVGSGFFLATASNGVTWPDHTRANITAQVIQIADGDTILIDTGRPAGGAEYHLIDGVRIFQYERVRFVGGVDTPELWGAPAGMPEAYAYQAKWATWQMLAGQQVHLEIRPERPRDDFGRLLAYVYVVYRGGWIQVNTELIRRGLGRLDPRFHRPEDRYYQYLWQRQIEAMVARRGVWGRFPHTLTLEELIAAPIDYINEAVTVRFVVTEARAGRRPAGLYIHGESPPAFNFRVFIPEERLAPFEQLGMGRDFWQAGLEVTVTGVANWDRGLLITLESPWQLTNLPVKFADPNLELVVREQLAKPSVPIFRADLAGLTALTAEGRGITDLRGIEQLVNLRVLRLSQNYLEDLTPLRALVHLEELSLSRNRIVDVRPLAELTQLRLLDLSANRINDLRPLVTLTRLTQLYGAENRLTDLSPIAVMTSLRRLDLSDNQIDDLTALAELTELTHLELADNEVRDISALSKLGALRVLHLDRNPLTTITTLSTVTELEELLLGWTGISDLHPLAQLTGLKRLNLGGNRISDVSSLAGLGQLEQLWLYWNQIEDITPLANLLRLTQLELRSNQITAIEALSGLIKLEWLCLAMNRVVDITALAELTQLRELSLSFNQIADVTPLVDNLGLTAGDTVFLGNNLLDKTPGAPAVEAINKLVRRGVSVR